MVIPEINLDLLKSYGKFSEVNEETILLRGGDKADNAYFIMTGGIRLFFYTDNGEVTLEFFFENSFVSSFSSFSNGKESTFWLETIEDSSLLILPKDKIQQIYKQFPELLNLYTKGLEKRLADYIQRLQTLLSLDAKKRYEELVSNRPEVVLRVKQKYIASYIGVKPESLSRIRARRVTN